MALTELQQAELKALSLRAQAARELKNIDDCLDSKMSTIAVYFRDENKFLSQVEIDLSENRNGLSKDSVEIEIREALKEKRRKLMAELGINGGR